MSNLQIDRLLETMLRRNCSQMEMIAGEPPRVKIDGQWRSLQADAVGFDDLESLSEQVVMQHRKQLEEIDLAIDFNYAEKLDIRFLANNYPYTTRIEIHRKSIAGG